MKPTVIDTTSSDALRGLIAGGERLIETADLIGRPMAANYMSMAIDILRAHLELATETDQSVL